MSFLVRPCRGNIVRLMKNRMLLNLNVQEQTRERRSRSEQHAPASEADKFIQNSTSPITTKCSNKTTINDVIGKMQLRFHEQTPRTTSVGNAKPVVIAIRGSLSDRKYKMDCHFRGTSSEHRKSVQADLESDAHVHNCIRNKDVDGAVQLLLVLSSRDKYPSRETLNILAAVSASIGHAEGVSKAADVCEVAYPMEFRWQMNYKHHRAECLWKGGDYVGALTLFEQLYRDYPLRRRKITNQSAFCVRDVVYRELSHLYEPLVACVGGMASIGDFPVSWVPAANLWRVAFCGQSLELHRLAERLLKEHPKMVTIVEGKLLAIVDEAKSRPELFQRLMQLVLVYEMRGSYSMVFGAYLECLCDQEDLKSITETVKYVTQYSITVPAITFQRAIELQNHQLSAKEIVPRRIKTDPTTEPKLQF